MKLFFPITLLALSVASVSAQSGSIRSVVKPDDEQRKLGKSYHSKSFAISDSEDEPERPNRANGQMGKRQTCSDTRFTLVCNWEAELDRKIPTSAPAPGGRLLEEWRPFLGESANPDDQKVIDVGNNRRLKVSLEHVKCTLGVGKKDSDDSSEDYEEVSQRVSFPDDDWSIEIREADDARPATSAGVSELYRFVRTIKFEGLEDPNNSADEISISAKVDISLNDKAGVLFYSSSSASFTCFTPGV